MCSICGMIDFYNEIDAKREKCEKLSSLIDKVENKFGKGSLMAGDIGIKSVVKKHQREMRHREF